MPSSSDNVGPLGSASSPVNKSSTSIAEEAEIKPGSKHKRRKQHVNKARLDALDRLIARDQARAPSKGGKLKRSAKGGATRKDTETETETDADTDADADAGATTDSVGLAAAPATIEPVPSATRQPVAETVAAATVEESRHTPEVAGTSSSASSVSHNQVILEYLQRYVVFQRKMCPARSARARCPPCWQRSAYTRSCCCVPQPLPGHRRGVSRQGGVVQP